MYLGHVCKIKKKIYGLKQALKASFDTLYGALSFMGFVKSWADPSLFGNFAKISPIYLLLYVNDINSIRVDGTD